MYLAKTADPGPMGLETDIIPVVSGAMERPNRRGIVVFITAVRMSGGNGHEHISDVTWKNPSTGQTGQSSRSEVVRWIKVDHGDAKVTDGRSTVDVGVVEAATPYLRTHADGKWTDNLLALPRF